MPKQGGVRGLGKLDAGGADQEWVREVPDGGDWEVGKVQRSRAGHEEKGR